MLVSISAGTGLSPHEAGVYRHCFTASCQAISPILFFTLIRVHQR